MAQLGKNTVILNRDGSSVRKLNDELDKIRELDNKIGVLSDKLSEADSIGISLHTGTQVIESVQDSLLEVDNIKGRTIVNLLGKLGNFSDTASWEEWAGTESYSDGVYTITGDGSAGNPQSALSTNKFTYKPKLGDVLYLRASVRATAGNPSDIRAYLWSPQTSTISNRAIIYSPELGRWYDISAKIPVTQEVIDNWAYVTVRIATYYNSASEALGNKTDYKEIMLVSLPDSHKSLSANELLELYPYVESMKSVMNPYVIAEGKNLLPPFYEWELVKDLSNYTSIEPYKLVINPSVDHVNPRVRVSVVPHQTYTISAKMSGEQARIGAFDVNTEEEVGAYTTSPLTFNVGNRTEVNIFISTRTGRGVHTFENIMMVAGTEALPFEPQNRTYKFYETELRSNVDGTQADEIFVENGETKVLRKQGFKVLDGSLPWEWHTFAGGYKQVKITDASRTFGAFMGHSETMVKYDGRIIESIVSGTSKADQAIIRNLDNTLFLSIANEDSGWGENYTPTPEEIKAYFNGWMMFHWESGVDTPYNGSGTKAWVKLYNGVGTPSSLNPKVISGQYTTTLPTEMNDMGYTPYVLQYQLANPIVESVESEGAVKLHKGLNQVTMGAGIIVREEAFPTLRNDGVYQVNGTAYGASDENYLSYRTKEIIDVYVDHKPFYASIYTNAADANRAGYQRVTFDKTPLEESNTVQVTYLPLDMHLIGLPPLEISGVYEGSLNEVVNQHTQKIADYGTRLSIVENEYVQRYPGVEWIEPTLLNGWELSSNGAFPIRYYKDDLNIVHVRGVANGGENGSVVFKFPVGYRPKHSVRVPTVFNSGSLFGIGYFDIKPNGDVQVLLDGNTYHTTFYMSFRAEQ